MDIQQSITNQTHVSVTLANHLFSKQSSKSNVVFSPLSIHVVLSLIAAGSKDQTLSELLSFLKTDTIHDLSALSSQLVSLMADGSPSGGPCLSFANGLWVEQTVPLRPSYKQVLDTVYNAAFYQVDFPNKADEVANEVNLWAEKKTSGLIKEIIPASAVSNFTNLIFANAIYFKGVWNEKFDTLDTKDYVFHLLDGSKVQTPFITTKKKQLVSQYDGFKLLGLPYFQGEDKQCTNILKELGLILPFSNGEGLTEMVDSSVGQSLYVSSIYHKSFVEVNERGTEAAGASTTVVAFGSRISNDKVDFVADHPFLFVIREDVSRAMLFMGQVVDPRC